MGVPFFATVEFNWSMKLRRKVMAIALATATCAAPAIAAVTNMDDAITGFLSEVEEITQEPTTPEITALSTILDEVTNPLSEVAIAVNPQPQRWVGANFTATETAVLNYFQDYGITDRAALAVLLGNVKQESRFETNICEGGHRGPYHTCRRGGFGLIQWTTVGRYSGLGRHANAIGASPTDLNTQLSYLVTEVEWKKVEHIFRSEGRGVASYMNAAYRWLGWGVEGKRTAYAWDYYNRLSLQ
ncbi:MAG: phage tail tip lysozyme [Candidatus Poseidoniales archaeon]|jgi:hypothetical protein